MKDAARDKSATRGVSQGRHRLVLAGEHRNNHAQGQSGNVTYSPRGGEQPAKKHRTTPTAAARGPLEAT